jgi:hypothetical protein
VADLREILQGPISSKEILIPSEMPSSLLSAEARDD